MKGLIPSFEKWVRILKLNLCMDLQNHFLADIMDCTPQCKLKKHGHCLTSAVTSENLKTLQTYIPQKCANAVRNRDLMGR